MNKFLYNFVDLSSTPSLDLRKFNGYLNLLKQLIAWEKCQDPYVGLRIAEVELKKPYLRCADYEVIALAVMRLLMMYAYNTVFYKGKFTISYRMKIPTRDVSFTVGTAISLKDSSGNAVPNKDVYSHILNIVAQKAEEYDEEVLSGLFIRLYMV